MLLPTRIEISVPLFLPGIERRAGIGLSDVSPRPSARGTCIYSSWGPQHRDLRLKCTCVSYILLPCRGLVGKTSPITPPKKAPAHCLCCDFGPFLFLLETPTSEAFPDCVSLQRGPQPPWPTGLQGMLCSLSTESLCRHHLPSLYSLRLKSQPGG